MIKSQKASEYSAMRAGTATNRMNSAWFSCGSAELAEHYQETHETQESGADQGSDEGSLIFAARLASPARSGWRQPLCSMSDAWYDRSLQWLRPVVFLIRRPEPAGELRCQFWIPECHDRPIGDRIRPAAATTGEGEHDGDPRLDVDVSPRGEVARQEPGR